MKIGARSCLKGTIVDVANGQTTAHVRIDGGSTVVAAAITNEVADELRLEAGKRLCGGESLRRHGRHGRLDPWSV
jgi:molybdopterin-binding protein